MPSAKLYFYQLNRPALITDNQGTTRVLYANGQPVCQTRYLLHAQKHLLGSDRSGSVMAAMTTSESIKTSYSPYGTTPTANSPIAVKYNGEIHDRSCAYLLGNGERAYTPNLMRFRSPDRASIFLPRNLNSYAYAAGDPINYFDPTGNLTARVAPRLDRMMPPKARRETIADRQQSLSSIGDITDNYRTDLVNRSSRLEYLEKEKKHLLKFRQAYNGSDRTQNHEFKLNPKRYGLNSDHVEMFRQISTKFNHTSSERKQYKRKYKDTIIDITKKNLTEILDEELKISWLHHDLDKYLELNFSTHQEIKRIQLDSSIWSIRRPDDD